MTYLACFIAGVLLCIATAVWYLPRHDKHVSERARVLAALDYCEFDRPFFRHLISRTNAVPVKMARLHAQGYLEAYKSSYEEAISKGFITSNTFYDAAYEEVCSYIEKYGIQQPDGAVTQESAPSAAP